MAVYVSKHVHTYMTNDIILHNNIDKYLKLAVDVPKWQQQKQEEDLHIQIKSFEQHLNPEDGENWIFRRVYKQSEQIR